MTQETPLEGGNLSATVRVGETVRRRSGPWAPAVQSLLAHLERVGFDAAPRPLGTDERGRQVVSFIPGDVHVGYPGRMPKWMFSENEAMVGAARLLRRYHDAVIGFEFPARAPWRFVAPGPHELICHNDWGPHNAVFRGQTPVAMLDWDSAGPGTREWDVGRSAYSWVPLYPKAPEHHLDWRAERFSLFCDTYGMGDRRRAIFDTLLVAVPFFADAIQAHADAGDPGFAKLAGWGVPRRLREEASLLRQQRDALSG